MFRPDGGGFFRRFDATPTTTTSLASKREPEVVFFVLSTRLPPLPPPLRPNASWRWFLRLCRPPATTPPPSRSNASWRWFFSLFRPSATTTTSLASKRELEVVIFDLSMRLPPPPPSCPNASRRWLISGFRHDTHHHLPRIQTRAGGGPFWRFQGICRRRRTSSPPTNRQRRKWSGGGEANERNVGSREAGEQDNWEGHGRGGARGNDDLLVVVPQSSCQRLPLSFVRGFLLRP